MAGYFFGQGTGKINESMGEKIDEIARQHGATFVNPRMPEGYRYWFETDRQMGSPFDENTAREVLAAVKAAGIRFPR